MSNQELIESYLNSMALLSKNTILSHHKVLYALSSGLQKSFLELTSSDIMTYIIKKRDLGEWKKPGTILQYIRVLRCFYKFLISQNLLKEEADPVKNIKTPPVRLEGELRTWTAEETRKLIKAAESPMIELRERLIFYLSLTSSLRASEIASIKKQHIDLEKRIIYMAKDDVKGRYREKCVPMFNRTKELLETYYIKYPNNSEYLFVNRFGKKLSYQTIYMSVRNVIDVAYPYKDSWKKPYGPHSGRHTFASRWIESNGNMYALRAIMGWNSFAQYDRYVNISSNFISQATHKIEKKMLAV